MSEPQRRPEKMDELSYTINNIAFVTLAAIVVVVWVIDVYLFMGGTNKHTLSQAIVVVAQRYPLLPFILGILVGHLLWPMRNHD